MNNRHILTRHGNALILALITLALIVTMTLSVTDHLVGLQKLEVLSRQKNQAQDAAEAFSQLIDDRINSNAQQKVATLVSPISSVDWFPCGYVDKFDDLKYVNGDCSVHGFRLNDCIIYWRLEPLACYDKTIKNTDNDIDNFITSTEVEKSGAKLYNFNNTDAANGASTPGLYGNADENAGLLYYELTVDAFAMRSQSRNDANPLSYISGNIPYTTTNESIHRPAAMHQLKKIVVVKKRSLFRYILCFLGKGPAADFEIEISVKEDLKGKVHSNGSVYFGPTQQQVTFNAGDPNPPRFTAVNGIFNQVKPSNLYYNRLDPFTNHLPDPWGNYSPYTSNLNIQINGTTIRKNNDSSTDINLSAFKNVCGNVREKSISRYDGISDYRPLEPFSLVPPPPVQPPPWIVNAGTALWLDGTNYYSGQRISGIFAGFATDMLRFRTANFGINVYSAQTIGAGINGEPSPALAALANALPSDPDPTNIAQPTTALILPPTRSARRNQGTVHSRPRSFDIFSQLPTYITNPVNAPILNRYIKNALGLNATQDPNYPGMGIVILERGSKVNTGTWPSGLRPGVVTWDPPAVRIDATHLGSTDGTGVSCYPVISPGFLQDYCHWMRSNYVVYFGWNTNNQFLDITDAFFSVPVGATNQHDLLACEDVFKDRRENMWWKDTDYHYIATANYNELYMNVLTLNMRAICNFIQNTPLNQLDPAAGATPVRSRFNGTIYVARTPRYSCFNVGSNFIPGSQVTATPVNADQFPIGVQNITILNQQMPTYRRAGEYNPLAPFGYSPLLAPALRTPFNQRLSLPIPMLDSIPPSAAPIMYPSIGDNYLATVNGVTDRSGTLMTTSAFGSTSSMWSAYPFQKGVRITNGNNLDWGGRRTDIINNTSTAKGLSIYTPNTCYLKGNFNQVSDGTTWPSTVSPSALANQPHYPSVAVYCDTLNVQSNNWNDTNVNALTNIAFPNASPTPGINHPVNYRGTYTTATNAPTGNKTSQRLCVVMHNVPCDRSHVKDSWIGNKLGPTRLEALFRLSEQWRLPRLCTYSYTGSVLILDRARYSRANMYGGIVMEGPIKEFNYNYELYREDPPFAEKDIETESW